jgi:hypothetical protein
MGMERGAALASKSAPLTTYHERVGKKKQNKEKVGSKRSPPLSPARETGRRRRGRTLAPRRTARRTAPPRPSLVVVGCPSWREDV